MSILLIIYLIFAHWVADFVFQDEEWALTKKNSFSSLLMHTWVYSTIIMIMTAYFLTPMGMYYFWVINFVTHTAVDYFTSKWVGMKFEKKQLGSAIPNFGAFTIIGLDQFIHYVILIMSFYLLYL